VLLENGFRAFVQVFCRECGTPVKMNGIVGYCPNKQCKNRATALKVLVKVIELKPMQDHSEPIPAHEAL